MSVSLTGPNPRPSVFPIPESTVRREVDLFGTFTDAELEALRNGNLDSLPDDSRERYLLDGCARPGMPEERRPAYQAGVCVGIGIYRYRCAELYDQGYELQERPFTPDNGPVFGDATASPSYWETVDAAVHLRLHEYLADKHSIALLGLLKTVWTNHGLKLMGVDNPAWGDDDYISMGLGDALAVFASAGE